MSMDASLPSFLWACPDEEPPLSVRQNDLRASTPIKQASRTCFSEIGRPVHPEHTTCRSEDSFGVSPVPIHNTFGYPLQSLAGILADRVVRDLIRDVLDFELGLVIPDYSIDETERFLDVLQGVEQVFSSEPAFRELGLTLVRGEMGRERVCSRRVADLSRTVVSALEGSPEGIKGRVLDLGCGSGLASHRIGAHFSGIDSMFFADVADYRDELVYGLPFIQIPRRGHLPFLDGEFDSVLLLTVLHHAEAPLELLSEARRVCRGNLYILESLIDVGDEPRSVIAREIDRDAWLRFERLERRFAALNTIQQLSHAGFQDWFYNWVVQGGVDVPMNFCSDRDWREHFEQNALDLLRYTIVGFDELTAPEYHAFYVCGLRD